MSDRGCSTCSNLGTSKHEYPYNECTNNRATDHYKPMTNADVIRNMTDEELADLLEDVRTHGFTDLGCCDDDLCDSDACDCCVHAWLQAEVKEGDTDAEP